VQLNARLRRLYAACKPTHRCKFTDVSTRTAQTKQSKRHLEAVEFQDMIKLRTKIVAETVAAKHTVRLLMTP
jgi:hypothetical protein